MLREGEEGRWGVGWRPGAWRLHCVPCCQPGCGESRGECGQGQCRDGPEPQERWLLLKRKAAGLHACNAEMQETWVRYLGQEAPLEEGMAATPVVLPGGSHGQRSLVGYSAWNRTVRHDWRDLAQKYKLPCLSCASQLKAPKITRFLVSELGFSGGLVVKNLLAEVGGPG